MTNTKHMTEDEFFEALRKIYGWTIIDSQTISTIRRSSPTYITGGCSQCDCPVCAVAHSMGTAEFGNTQFYDAACSIGLSEDLAREIADASDMPYERTNPDTRKGELRLKLLEATATNS